MSDPSAVIPTPEERLMVGESLTDWHVDGEICCPDCGRYFSVNCPLEILQRFTVTHECGREPE